MAVPSKLHDLTSSHLENWASQAILQTAHAKVAQRIPLLAQADPSWLAVQIHVHTGQRHSLGETDRTFPIMSAIKPFLLLYLLEQFGAEKVFEWVGVLPSDQPFNSLNQLIADRGHPRNPMINSGAILLSGHLPGKTGTDRCQALCEWLNAKAGCQLTLDEAMLASVRSAGREPNQSLVRHLSETKHITKPATVIDAYEQICCLSGNVVDLACLGDLLAYERSLISLQHRQAVNALMLTCGLYEASALYAVKVGLPMKSGISGALIAIVPRQGTIACHSPALDSVGNPIAGLVFVETLTNALQLSPFI